MARKVKIPPKTNSSPVEPAEPVLVPDVATQAHPAVPPDEPILEKNPPDNETKLQNLLPEINALAQKVGGIRKLSELVGTLESAGK